MNIQTTSKRSGDTATKSRAEEQAADYTAFQLKLMGRFCVSALVSVAAVAGLYFFLWRQRMGDWVVALLEQWTGAGHEEAFYLYNDYFRGYKELFFGVAIAVVFLGLLWYLFRWMTRYFREIHQGIDSLLTQQGDPVRLSAEMRPFEEKLNTVRGILAQREQEARNAERRKDELVMYLAHDIRTPLTSVIGYLNLLEELPDLPREERARYIGISLEKARRLERMINEFFEITRYNTQQIQLAGASVDLEYLLEQVIDEHIPLFAGRGNHVAFQAAGSLELWGDADQLARVFNNLLKNAAAYSDPGTEVVVQARREESGEITVTVSSRGPTIPQEKLETLFEKFYRLDEARTSDTGGTGLGLAIAREIVTLHGGTITANSENGITTFTVRLPVGQST